MVSRHPPGRVPSADRRAFTEARPAAFHRDRFPAAAGGLVSRKAYPSRAGPFRIPAGFDVPIRMTCFDQAAARGRIPWIRIGRR